ncbi:MAG: two-component system response regulator [Roseiflexaceae bacterium]
MSSSLPPSILVIDEDSQLTYLIQRYALSCGCRCISAHDADMALLLALQDRPALIVLDIATQSAQSRQLVQRLKAERATFDIPLVICSAVADGIRIWEEGADYYLGKPVLYDDFVATLTEAGVSLPQE